MLGWLLVLGVLADVGELSRRGVIHLSVPLKFHLTSTQIDSVKLSVTSSVSSVLVSPQGLGYGYK